MEITDRVCGLRIGQVKELIRDYKQDKKSRPAILDRLLQLGLIDEDGVYSQKLLTLISTFKDKLWPSEIAYLSELIKLREPIPAKFLARLIRLKDSDPILKIIVNAITCKNSKYI